MQTPGSQVEPASQKVTVTQAGAFGISVALFASAVFFVLVYRLLTLRRERAALQKELSRARRLADVADILHGSSDSTREKLKNVAHALASEGEKDGWRCRIVVHSDSTFLPPPSERLGFHLPMTMEGQTVGTLIVTTGSAELDEIDQNFFEGLARSLGHFIHKEKLWNDFHGELQQMQASLLLHADMGNHKNPDIPSDIAAPDHRTVEHMLSMLGLIRKKPETPAAPPTVPKPRY